MRKKNFKIYIFLLLALLVVQVSVFVWLVSPVLSGFFVKETGYIVEDVSDSILKVGGILKVKELCFEGGGCIKSAVELMEDVEILSPYCEKVTFKANQIYSPEEVCRMYGELIGKNKVCSSNETLICSKKDSSFPQRLTSCNEKCAESFSGTPYLIEVECCNAKKILYNGDPKDKIDIVVIGEGYSDSEQFYQFINKLFDDKNFYPVQEEGIVKIKEMNFFGYYPYKEFKSQFNVWFLNGGFAEGPRDQGRCTWGNNADLDFYTFFKNVVESNELSFADQIARFTSDKAQWSNSYIISTGCGLCSQIKDLCVKVLVHEAGHWFGLYDEYSYGYSGNLSRELNCANNQDTASRLWGNYVGEGEGDLLTTGYYQGCFLDNLIRPVQCGLMRGCTGYYERDYGEYEIYLIKKSIEEKLKNGI